MDFSPGRPPTDEDFVKAIHPYINNPDSSPGRPPTNEDFGEAIIGPADTARADRIGILIDRWKPGARRWARDSGVTGQ